MSLGTAVHVLALEVPSITHVTVWREGPLGINKTALVYIFATVATLLVFWLGTRQKRMVPAGIFQNTAESGIDFVKNQIIMQTIGTDGMRFLPYLAALFFFLFFSNITEVLPGVQFPANARFGIPAILALATWVIYMTIGIVKQGPFTFLKNSTWPPGVPLPIKIILVAPIEFIQVLIVRPFSLAVRLFANMLAGHLILVTFGAICAALWAAKITVVILPFSFALLVAMTAFEVLVSFLQAFIFTILTAVYIGTSLHPEH
jgi:F-type H+-transporting ATPase subunit a